MARYSQIVFLPWAALNSELQVGPVQFWPFNRDTAHKYVADVPTRQFLGRYFRRYRNPLDKSVDTVVVCSLGRVDHRVLNTEELDDIRTAIDCLAFSVIGPMTKSGLDSYPAGVRKPSADRYDFYIQNFTPKNFRVSVPFYGSVELNRIHFVRGMSISEHPRHPDRKLLAALGKFLWSRAARSRRVPIARGLEWFKRAHQAADRLSDPSRIVMMATAFETLLQIQSEQYKASSMADELETLIRAHDWAKKHSRPRRYKNRVKYKTRTLPGWWLWNFYQTRNRIVHGEPLSEADIWTHMTDDRRYSQVSVATAIFLEAIAWRLWENRLYGQRFDPRRLRGLGTDQVGSNDLPAHFFERSSFGKLHDVLAWSRKRKVHRKA